MASELAAKFVEHPLWQLDTDGPSSRLDAARGGLPDGWVTGDDEFGRCSELRAQLRLRRRRYVLDVPCNTRVRDPQERRPATRPGGRPRFPEFERVDRWAARQPGGRWRKVEGK